MSPDEVALPDGTAGAKVPNAPPTEAERFGVDVREPAKTAAGSLTPTNVAKSVPSLAEPSEGSAYPFAARNAITSGT